MVKKIDPERLNLRLEFGQPGPVGKVNPNTGEAETGFVESFKLWAGQWSLTYEQNMTLNGEADSNNAVFFVRHNSAVKQGMQLRRNNVDVYHIDNVDYDDGLPPDGYDLITCHEVNKHG